MHLETVDWCILAASFAFYALLGLWAARRAGEDFQSYFLGRRKMPWWLLGISMVATTFATDTPNLVTGIVRQNGVLGNWVWWAFALTGTSTVFFFAKLWRRSAVLTDVEYYELRYSGRAAAWLRGFRAVYLGVVFNVLIMANVTLAAVKIGGVLLGLSPLQSIAIASAVTLLYSVAGGLTGVLITDLVQFAIAMLGSIWAAHYVLGLPEVGGLSALLARPEIAPKLSLVPSLSDLGQGTVAALFLVPLLVQWWSTYYPGAEPGGGGYVVQRVLAARSESHAVGATLLFNVLHYALRPWPWILVALASMVVYPDLAALREAFPAIDASIVRDDLAYPAMLTHLPAGLLGLVVASLIAAFMSTMSTQVNWGSSLLVNDLYLRFLKPTATQREQVRAGRACTLLLMLLSCGLALLLEDALSSFELLLQIGAGTGLLLLLRWFWWRINAAAEIAAMIASFASAAALYLYRRQGGVLDASLSICIGVAFTSAAWIATALCTRPTAEATLRNFYKRIQPAGPGWRALLERARAEGHELRDERSTERLWPALLATLSATIAIWCLIFATGSLLYGHQAQALAQVSIALGGGFVVWRCWPRLGLH